MHRRALASFLAVLAASVAGCGGASGSSHLSGQSSGANLLAYLHQIEPIRLAVNRLLEGADPILAADRERHISPAQATRRMEALERRFAAYTVQIAAIRPKTSPLRSLQASYAHTYILEDSYLNALAAGLAERKLDDLPDTQSEQRAAIIEWRIGLTVLAGRLSLALPSDLQAAGRGEIAPSPGGS